MITFVLGVFALVALHLFLDRVLWPVLWRISPPWPRQPINEEFVQLFGDAVKRAYEERSCLSP